MRVDDPANSLRTVSLLPPALDRDRLVSLSAAQWVDAVAEVARLRAEQLAGVTQGAPLVLTEGRLLACDPSLSVWDGASEFESKGFFDVEDIPAWDTWITFVTRDARSGMAWAATGGALISWVPLEFVEIVARGIWANPVEGVRWLEDVDHDLADELITGR